MAMAMAAMGWDGSRGIPIFSRRIFEFDFSIGKSTTTSD